MNDSFTILTWNCLAQKFLNGKIKTEFEHCLGKMYSERKFRITKIHEILSLYDYDIICLQEVELNNIKNKDNDIYLPFSEEFKYILHSYYFIEQTFKKWNNGVGNVIMCKKDKFLIKTTESRSRALLCILEHIFTKKQLFIANVHLQAGYSHEDERINQIINIVEKANTCGVPNIIICGDFNTCANYKLPIPSGRQSVINILKNKNNKTKPHNISFKEIAISSPYTYFSPTGNGHERYDHIFYSNTLEQIGSLYLNKDLINTTKKSPSFDWPSDHALIGGILKFY
jgi:endonuclease/exonuclease/phosphatase family metal-dependent hydrolase